jgi:hypothetical protein
MWQHSWASSLLECETRNNTILKARETKLGEYNSGSSLSRKSKKKPHTDASRQNSENTHSKLPQLTVIAGNYEKYTFKSSATRSEAGTFKHIFKFPDHVVSAG